MEKLNKYFSRFIIKTSLFAALLFLLVFLIHGSEWLIDKIFPRLGPLMWGILITDIIFILMFAPLKKTRIFLSIILINSCYLYCLLLWIWTFLVTYTAWGSTAVFLGLYIGGVGIVPFAMTAAALEGQWLVSIQLLLLACLIFESRVLGMFMKKSS